MKRDTSYTKIWENNYGPIPKDKDGRSYEIHHIDGNSSNNTLENLACLSIMEHYETHLKQGDYMAARYIAMRMSIDPETQKSLLSKAQKERVENGTHNFLSKNGGSERASKQQLKRIETGVHQFLTKDFEENRLSAYHRSLNDRRSNGTYHLLIDNPNNKMLKEGTHNFLGAQQNKNMLAKGIHPSQIKKDCPHCGRVLDAGNYGRYHGDKCKMKDSNE